MILRLRQKTKLSLNIFVHFGFGLDFLVQGEQREEEFWTENNFVRREERRGIGLRIFLSKQGEKGEREFGEREEKNLSK